MRWYGQGIHPPNSVQEARGPVGPGPRARFCPGLERGLDAALARFAGAFLNDLPEFADANPSLERFAKAHWDRLSPSLPPGVEGSVRVWENESAWAGYGNWHPEPKAR